MWQIGKSKASHAAYSSDNALLHPQCCIRSICFLYTLSLSIITEARSLTLGQFKKLSRFTPLRSLLHGERHFARNLKRSLLPWKALMHGRVSRHSCLPNKTYYESALLFIRLCKPRGSGRSPDNRCNPFSGTRRRGASIHMNQPWIKLIYNDQVYTGAHGCIH